MIQLKNIYLVDIKDEVKAEQILKQLLQKDPDKLEYLLEMGTFITIKAIMLRQLNILITREYKILLMLIT